MSFLNTMRSMPMPPVKNVLNVALQTARQVVPSKNKQNDYEQPQGDNMSGGSGGGGSVSGVRSPPQVPPRPQNVHFAESDGDTGGTTELNPLNPFTNPKAYYQEGAEQPAPGQYQETGFNQPSDFDNGYQAGGYPKRQGSVQSFGSDSTFAGGCEGEVAGGAKINEYQAAWNVTNAIQVRWF
uniref:(northern house mosquito) hypothetical protein n=1 Tax=Culex pipiens TaxID=7175 RepID=A0A8D8BZV9_CULPI